MLPMELVLTFFADIDFSAIKQHDANLCESLAVMALFRFVMRYYTPRREREDYSTAATKAR